MSRWNRRGGDLALEAPGAAGLVRMEAVRSATDLPQLLDLARVGRSDGRRRATRYGDTSGRRASLSTFIATAPVGECVGLAQSAAVRFKRAARRFGRVPVKARRDLEAAKSAAEVIAAMGSASVDELAACPYDWRTRGSSPRTVVAP